MTMKPSAAAIATPEDVEAQPADHADPRDPSDPTPWHKRPRVEDDVERPVPPLSEADLGVSPAFLQDLLLKTLHVRGASTGDADAARVARSRPSAHFRPHRTRWRRPARRREALARPTQRSN